MVGGQTTVTADTPAAELYPADDYGGIYIGLYEAVSGWTIQTLGSVQESFAPGTPIVCAIEPTTIPEAQKTSGDEVAVMLVIRDSSGAPVSDSHETMKMVSITTLPPRSVPTDSPTMVMMALSVLCSTL